MHGCYKNNILDILEYYKDDITDQKRLKTAQNGCLRLFLSLKSKLTAINSIFGEILHGLYVTLINTIFEGWPKSGKSLIA